MGSRRGSISTPIIADGLVFNMDAANRASYPKIGVTWNDTIGDKNGTLTNDPTFNNNNNGSNFSFDGVDDYVTMGDVLNFDRSNAFSVSMWVKYDTAGTDIFISKSTAAGKGWGLFTYSNYLYFQMIELNNARKIVTRGGTTFPT